MPNRIAEAVTDDEPRQVPNPTNFQRLYYDPHRGVLYRSTRALDTRNHYEIVDDWDDAAEIRAHGQFPLVVDDEVNLDALSPKDLNQYLEYERILQYERFPPETHMIPFHLLSEDRLHRDAEESLRREALEHERRGGQPYPGRMEDLEPVRPGRLQDSRAPGAMPRVAGPMAAVARPRPAPPAGMGSIASAFAPEAFVDLLRASGIDLGAGAAQFLDRARGERMWPMPGGRFAPDTMHDAAPIHRQLAPGFLGLQDAPPSIPKPGEIETPREYEGNVERGRLWDKMREAEPPGPEASGRPSRLIPLAQALPMIYQGRA